MEESEEMKTRKQNCQGFQMIEIEFNKPNRIRSSTQSARNLQQNRMDRRVTIALLGIIIKPSTLLESVPSLVQPHRKLDTQIIFKLAIYHESSAMRDVNAE